MAATSPGARRRCFAAAVAVGLVNGLLIVRYNLPPFLATLGMTFFLAGVNLYLDASSGRKDRDVVSGCGGSTRWGFVPATVVVTNAASRRDRDLCRQHRFGLRLRAVGWNEKSARLAGVSPARSRSRPTSVRRCSLRAAGLFIASRTGSGDPLVGNSYQLSSISASVLGGVDLLGGRGTVWGAIAGALGARDDRQRPQPARRRRLLAMDRPGRSSCSWPSRSTR